MIRHLVFLTAFAACTSASATENPPFTTKFVETLRAYSKCVQEVVDRHNSSSTPPAKIAERAVGACENRYLAAEVQLTNDFVAQQGYSSQAAKSSAVRSLSGLKTRMTKAALVYAQGKR